jgi:hypothetical protein
VVSRETKWSLDEEGEVLFVSLDPSWVAFAGIEGRSSSLSDRVETDMGWRGERVAMKAGVMYGSEESCNVSGRVGL